MTPSISTEGTALIVTMTMTRISAVRVAARRNVVCRTERLFRVKASLNPLAVPAALVISTSVSASNTTCGTGIGTKGPISRVSETPLSIRRPGEAFRQRDLHRSARRVGERLRLHRLVGIADTPELFG